MTDAPPPVLVEEGDGPVILGMPHTGTWLPEAVFDALNPTGRLLADTDWHIDRLYAGLLGGVTTVRATFHRYVIDANRDPAGASLYPGQNTTGLVPLTDFEGRPIWASPPDDAETARRLAAFHAPYHGALAAQVARVKARHGVAILYDCHSIRCEIPFLFEGRLPDFNIGDNDGRACAPAVTAAVRDAVGKAAGFTRVVNGRFKGGWTTRHYGAPEKNVHAIQMELAQITHLDTEAPPFAYSDQKAERLRPALADALARLEALAPVLAAGG